MKKPEITEGEWKSTEDLVISHPLGLVADCSGIMGYETDCKNAKAISAVPELIDALIETRELVFWCNKHFSQWELKLEKMDKALTKAGVEI